MFGNDWKKTLKTYLPAIGGALGGPVGALAIKAGLSAFGASDDDIKKAGNPIDLLKSIVLGATPDEVKNAQISDEKFRTDMAKIGVKIETLHQKDRASARDMAKQLGAFWQNMVGITLIAAVLGILFYIIVVGLLPESNDIAVLVLGNVMGWAGSYIVFLFGSSKGSKEKDKQISGLITTISDK